MDLIYPSIDFPPPPAVRLQVPDGWVRVDAADALLAAADPGSSPGFAANIIVTVGRVVGDEDLDAVVERQQQASGRETHLERQAHEPIAGRDAVWSATSYAPTPERPVSFFQAQATLLIPRRERVADAITLIGTCAAASSEHYAPIFRDTFLSLVVDE